jgi:HSP20 family protein
MTNIAKFLDHNVFEPYDVLFRNFFDKDSFFLPAVNAKPSYPVDIYETDNSIVLEIAAAGLDKDDIQIEECDGVLNVSYNKTEEANQNDPIYIQKSIAKRSFNMCWKFSEKFDLKKIDAKMDKGILTISVPKGEEKRQIKNLIQIK